MITLVLSAVLAAPFPLPSIDGKPLAVTQQQKSFRLPMRFEKTRQFYRERLGEAAGVSLKESGAPGARVLTITTSQKGETWTKAIVKERETETVVDVTPVLRLDAEKIAGNGRPLVEFVFGRSPDAAKAAAEIDHTEAMRAR